MVFQSWVSQDLLKQEGQSLNTEPETQQFFLRSHVHDSSGICMQHLGQGLALSHKTTTFLEKKLTVCKEWGLLFVSLLNLFKLG